MLIHISKLIIYNDNNAEMIRPVISKNVDEWSMSLEAQEIQMSMSMINYTTQCSVELIPFRH